MEILARLHCQEDYLPDCIHKQIIWYVGENKDFYSTERETMSWLMKQYLYHEFDAIIIVDSR